MAGYQGKYQPNLCLKEYYYSVRVRPSLRLEFNSRRNSSEYFMVMSELFPISKSNSCLNDLSVYLSTDYSWKSATDGKVHTYGLNEYPKNKYIFVNQREKINFTPTILVNPHFKDNTKVYFNPKFSVNNDSGSSKPSIHINPNVINPLHSTRHTISFNRYTLNQFKSESTFTDRSKVLISTKTKFIKLPDSKQNLNGILNTSSTLQKNSNITFPNNLNNKTHTKVIPPSCKKTLNKFIKLPESKQDPNSILNKSSKLQKSSYKIHNFNNKTHNTVSPSCSHKTSQYNLNNLTNKTTRSPLGSSQINKKIYSTRTKIVNASIKRPKTSNSVYKKNSINTRFKYISSDGIARKISRHIFRSRHKIVNHNTSNSKKLNMSSQATKLNIRKRYIFINKFNSSSFLANNVILKNKKPKDFININGILYQNTPSRLKKYVFSKVQRKSQTLSPLTLSNENRQQAPRTRRVSLTHKRKLSLGKYRVVRAQIPSSRSMKKSNVPCRIYKRFGKCPGQKNGTCIKLHNPEQIILCPRFLQGTCVKKNCLLSHKVSPEKMPTCKYFLEGLCSKDDCQYLHVKISPKADICRDFLEGFCRLGIKCEKRHQLLCPEFEKTGKCPKRRCEYPHNYLKATLGRAVGKKIIKKHVEKKLPNSLLKKKKDNTEKSNIRYYVEEMGNEEKSRDDSGVKRPKLGTLPVFIPLNEVPEKEADSSN